MTSRRLSPAEARLVAGVWVVLAGLTVAHRALEHGDKGAGYVGAIALSAAVVFAVWGLLTPLVFRLACRYPLDGGPARAGGPLARRVALHVGVALAVAVGVDALDGAVKAGLLGRMAGEAPVRSLARVKFLDDLTIYLALLGAALARDYFLRYRDRRDEAAALEAERLALQGQLTEARLGALRAQLDPHFLFNTLNAASALVDVDAAGARRVLARLSDLLRRALDAVPGRAVQLRDELAFVRAYLEIHEVRLGDRLVVEEDVAARALDALVPPLVLQPLVENAVEHGVGQVPGVGRIALGARVEGDGGDDVLVLTVRDNGPGPSAAPAGDGVSGGGVPDETGRQRRGIGLSTTRERLAALYGEAASLSVRTAEGGGAEAVVRLPYRTEDGAGTPPREASPLPSLAADG